MQSTTRFHIRRNLFPDKKKEIISMSAYNCNIVTQVVIICVACHCCPRNGIEINTFSARREVNDAAIFFRQKTPAFLLRKEDSIYDTEYRLSLLSLLSHREGRNRPIPSKFPKTYTLSKSNI